MGSKLSRREFLRMAALTAAGTALAGCATSTPEPAPKAEEPTATPKPVEPTATTKPPEQETVVLNYWMPSGDLGTWAPHEKWAQKYQEMHPNVKFQVAGPPWEEYWTKLPLNIAAGTGPEIMWFHIAFTQQFVDGGLIEAWPEEDVAEIQDLFSGVNTGVINGKRYYWAEGLMTGLIFYNKKLWEEAGLSEADIPTSWPKLIELARQVTVYDAAGEVQRAGFNWGHDDVRWTWLMLKYQLGEWAFSEDGRRGFINTEGGRTAGQMLVDWEFEDKVGSTDLPGVFEAFTSDLAIMAYSWGWMASSLLTDYPDMAWGIFRLPSMDGNTPPCYERHDAEASSAVNPQTSAEKKQVCFDFIKWYMTDVDLMKERAKLGVAPVLKSIRDDVDTWGTPVVKASLEQIDRTISFGTPPPDWENALNLFTEPVYIARSDSIEAGLAASQAAVDEALSKPENIYWGDRGYAHADEMHEPQVLS